ncbi:hypothetical protein TNCV_297661 [Trichonephila clavipes]|nr:hypothetical protein TNCV_297661 [Trichonephila clavipes]
MVDSGSQMSLILRACANKLGLPVKTTNHRISGVDNIVAETAFFEVHIVLKSYYCSEIFDVDALTVNNVTVNLPNLLFKTHRGLIWKVYIKNYLQSSWFMIFSGNFGKIESLPDSDAVQFLKRSEELGVVHVTPKRSVRVARTQSEDGT